VQSTPKPPHASLPMQSTSQGPAPQVTLPDRHVSPPLHVTLQGPAAGHKTPAAHASSVAPPRPQRTMQPVAFLQSTGVFLHALLRQVISQNWPVGQVSLKVPPSVIVQ
jgi:hypothetical protein